jgi:hypothetical protein
MKIDFFIIVQTAIILNVQPSFIGYHKKQQTGLHTGTDTIEMELEQGYIGVNMERITFRNSGNKKVSKVNITLSRLGGGDTNYL